MSQALISVSLFPYIGAGDDGLYGSESRVSAARADLVRDVRRLCHSLRDHPSLAGVTIGSEDDVLSGWDAPALNKASTVGLAASACASELGSSSSRPAVGLFVNLAALRSDMVLEMAQQAALEFFMVRSDSASPALLNATAVQLSIADMKCKRPVLFEVSVSTTRSSVRDVSNLENLTSSSTTSPSSPSSAAASAASLVGSVQCVKAVASQFQRGVVPPLHVKDLRFQASALMARLKAAERASAEMSSSGVSAGVAVAELLDQHWRGQVLALTTLSDDASQTVEVASECEFGLENNYVPGTCSISRRPPNGIRDLVTSSSSSSPATDWPEVTPEQAGLLQYFTSTALTNRHCLRVRPAGQAVASYFGASDISTGDTSCFASLSPVYIDWLLFNESDVFAEGELDASPETSAYVTLIIVVVLALVMVGVHASILYGWTRDVFVPLKLPKAGPSSSSSKAPSASSPSSRSPPAPAAPAADEAAPEDTRFEAEVCIWGLDWCPSHSSKQVASGTRPGGDAGAPAASATQGAVHGAAPSFKDVRVPIRDEAGAVRRGELAAGVRLVRPGAPKTIECLATRASTTFRINVTALRQKLSATMTLDTVLAAARAVLSEVASELFQSSQGPAVAAAPNEDDEVAMFQAGEECPTAVAIACIAARSLKHIEGHFAYELGPATNAMKQLHLVTSPQDDTVFSITKFMKRRLQFLVTYRTAWYLAGHVVHAPSRAYRVISRILRDGIGSVEDLQKPDRIQSCQGAEYRISLDELRDGLDAIHSLTHDTLNARNARCVGGFVPLWCCNVLGGGCSCCCESMVRFAAVSQFRNVNFDSLELVS